MNVLKAVILSDSAELQSLLAGILNRNFPCSLLTIADTPEAVIELNSRLGPQLIVFDASSPNRKDFAFIDRIRRDNHAGSIFVLSSQPDEDYRRSMLDAGADRYFDITSETFIEDLYARLSESFINEVANEALGDHGISQ